MCTHGKYIHNKYTHERIFVKCGQCHACQMEKASAHYSRVMSHEYSESGDKYFRLFVTLNYSNQCLPVVYAYDAYKKDIPVYRHIRYSCRRSPSGRFRRYRENGRFQVTTLHLNSVDLNRGYNKSLSGLEIPQNWPYGGVCFGVALAKDFSDFLQRLRMNLRRYYNLDTRNVGFSYYKVQEYGPTTLRPHFHVILYFPISWKKDYYRIRRAIIQAWPFCSFRQMRENIGVAVSGQRYVSQYTCRPSSYPSYFQIRSISQKANFSRGYGFGRSAFLSSGVLDAVQRKDFTYNYQTMRDNKPVTVVSPIPKYVIDRYFPKFKGMRFLDSRSLSAVLCSPERIYSYRIPLGLSDDDAKAIKSRLEKARSYLGVSWYEYKELYINFMCSYPLWRMKVDLLSITEPEQWDEYYTNNDEAVFYLVNRGCLMTDALSNKVYEKALDVFSRVFTQITVSDVLNPNNFQLNISKDYELEIKYQEWVKRAKLNDYAASLNHYFVEYELEKYDYAEHIA